MKQPRILEETYDKKCSCCKNINRSAISKHLKKMQEENTIHREGSQRAGRWVIISKS